jgi:hypothetical protein
MDESSRHPAPRTSGDGRRAQVWGRPGGDRRVRQPLPRTRVRQQPRPVAIAAGRANEHLYDPTRASTSTYGGPGTGNCSWGGAADPHSKKTGIRCQMTISAKCGNGGAAATWFSGMRANARPARRAGPIVRLPQFRSSGPTKEAHRRALNRSDGLLRSVAGGRACGAMI